MLNDIYHNISPIAFSIGDLSVRWYGISYVLGAVIASLVFYRAALRIGKAVSLEWLLSLLIAVMLGVVIGGRLGYVLFYDLPYFAANPAQVLAFSQGGMSFHGGLIGVLIAVIIFWRIGVRPQNVMSLLQLADLIVIAAPWALLVVRLANFINGELWGAPTDLPWGVTFDDTGGGAEARHPTQLYEALLEGLLLGLLMQFALRRTVRKMGSDPNFAKVSAMGSDPKIAYPAGTFVSIFLIGYAICRILVEFVRVPDAQLGYLAGGWLTMGMCLSFAMLLAGIILLVIIFAKINSRKHS